MYLIPTILLQVIIILSLDFGHPLATPDIFLLLMCPPTLHFPEESQYSSRMSQIMPLFFSQPYDDHPPNPPSLRIRFLTVARRALSDQILSLTSLTSALTTVTLAGSTAVALVFVADPVSAQATSPQHSRVLNSFVPSCYKYLWLLTRVLSLAYWAHTQERHNAAKQPSADVRLDLENPYLCFLIPWVGKY